VYISFSFEVCVCVFFFSSRRRHTRFSRDWSSDVCSSDLSRMFEGTLVDLVPFEDDFAVYLESWMNEEAWFRAQLWERREPHAEADVKKFTEQLGKNERGALIGCRTKAGAPIGG